MQIYELKYYSWVISENKGTWTEQWGQETGTKSELAGQKDPFAHDERQSRKHPTVSYLWDAFSLTRFSKVQNRTNSDGGTVMRAYSPSWGRKIIALRLLHLFEWFSWVPLWDPVSTFKRKGGKSKVGSPEKVLKQLESPSVKLIPEPVWLRHRLCLLHTVSRKLQLIFSG